MMRRSLRSMFTFAAILASGAAVATGAAGIVGQQALNGINREMAAAQTHLRNQMQADMMHDALRSDVYAARLSAGRNAAEAASIRAD